jgi:single-strand DNA-binding protein
MVIGKLVQRSFETEGRKRTVVEIQVQHVGPDLQFATAQVEKVTSEKATAEKQSA